MTTNTAELISAADEKELNNQLDEEMKTNGDVKESDDLAIEGNETDKDKPADGDDKTDAPEADKKEGGGSWQELKAELATTQALMVELEQVAKAAVMDLSMQVTTQAELITQLQARLETLEARPEAPPIHTPPQQATEAQKPPQLNEPEKDQKGQQAAAPRKRRLQWL